MCLIVKGMGQMMLREMRLVVQNQKCDTDHIMRKMEIPKTVDTTH